MTKITQMLDTETQSILHDNGFETIPFDALVEALQKDGIDKTRNWVAGPVEPLDDDRVDTLPSTSEASLHCALSRWRLARPPRGPRIPA